LWEAKPTFFGAELCTQFILDAILGPRKSLATRVARVIRRRSINQFKPSLPSPRTHGARPLPCAPPAVDERRISHHARPTLIEWVSSRVGPALAGRPRKVRGSTSQVTCRGVHRHFQAFHSIINPPNNTLHHVAVCHTPFQISRVPPFPFQLVRGSNRSRCLPPVRVSISNTCDSPRHSGGPCTTWLRSPRSMVIMTL